MSSKYDNLKMERRSENKNTSSGSKRLKIGKGKKKLNTGSGWKCLKKGAGASRTRTWPKDERFEIYAEGMKTRKEKTRSHNMPNKALAQRQPRKYKNARCFNSRMVWMFCQNVRTERRRRPTKKERRIETKKKKKKKKKNPRTANSPKGKYREKLPASLKPVWTRF